MMFTFSAYVLKTVWIADSQDMTALSAASLEDFLSIYCALTSEKSMDTKAFSFLEFSEHNK